jgi:molecular chaperone GrpE (heat shock protein)
MKDQIQEIEEILTQTLRKIYEQGRQAEDLKNQHKAEKIKLMAMMLNLSDLPETTPNTQALIEQQLLEGFGVTEFKLTSRFNPQSATIVGTVEDMTQPHHFITKIVKKAFAFENDIIRKAEVIVVEN